MPRNWFHQKEIRTTCELFAVLDPTFNDIRVSLFCVAMCKTQCKIYLGYINSVLNPLIYGMVREFSLFLFSLKEIRYHWPAFVNDDFQQSLRRALRGIGRGRPDLRVSVSNF